ncbi:MAG: metal ABC transporter solute-binding protein, Zn/Mn family [Anaerolineae bacterium]
MKRLFSILSMLFFLTACSQPGASRSAQEATVLASTTILADMTQRVAGQRLTVASLLPVGVDPHTYQPTPADVARLAASKVLVVNGLGYEQFMATLLKNAGGNQLIITASERLEPLREEIHASEAESASGPAGEALDPHMWLDPNLAVGYVENIRDGLIRFDPAGAETYRANAEAYIAQLQALDRWIAEQVQSIPPQRRLLVTNHEAFGYFARRYGFTVVGTVIPGLSSEAETSAQGLAAVIDQIRASGAPAIFLGEVENPALAKQIAAETGVKVVADLYLESLTAGAPAATYLDMMKYDVSRIVEALK